MSAEKNLDTELIKILVVEDDMDLQRLIARFIEKAIACKILKAANGLQALTMLLTDSAKPDLIILDIELPFLNGEEILRIIRHKPEFDNVPIVICTAVNHMEKVQEIVKHRIDGYVIKPLDRTLLLKKILPLLKIDSVDYGYFKRLHFQEDFELRKKMRKNFK